MADTMLFLVVELAAPVEHRDAFLAACRANAASALRDEPGCRRFDVLETADEPELVVLLEAYDDRSAFDAHRLTPHFAAYAAEVVRLGVARPRVRFLSRIP